MLRKQDGDILAWIVAIIVFCLVYLWNPPGLKYFPIEGVWQWEAIDGSPAMSWYARLAYALASAAGAGMSVWVLGILLGWRGEKTLSETTVYALSAVLAFILALAAVYIVWHEFSVLSKS